MTRLHVHLAVEQLDDSIRFYSTLFGVEPIVRQADYAKWMLDDPMVNFAISQRGARPGLDHLGIQVESAEELEAINARLRDAALPAHEQKDAACCYARSDKYWSVDPQGVPWEAFHTLSAIPTFGTDEAIRVEKSACCAPASKQSCC